MLNAPLVKKVLKWFAGIGLVAAYILCVKQFATIYSADVDFKLSQEYLNSGDFMTGLSYANSAVEKNPNEPMYLRNRAKVYILGSSGLDAEANFTLKTLALSDLQNAYKLNPENLATIRNVVPLYYFLSVQDLTKPVTADNLDYKFLAYTKDFFIQNKNISPNDVGIYVLMAKYENKLQMHGELTSSLEKIKQLRPDLLEWHESLQFYWDN
ncbi:MAG: hypothetical protein ACD_22C00072G0006 [uncultured bacterium]|nr:MAG: hypothetical protein ACD_22C00072G0006 [uncultured bacterium]